MAVLRGLLAKVSTLHNALALLVLDHAPGRDRGPPGVLRLCFTLIFYGRPTRAPSVDREFLFSVIPQTLKETLSMNKTFADQDFMGIPPREQSFVDQDFMGIPPRKQSFADKDFMGIPPREQSSCLPGF